MFVTMLSPSQCAATCMVLDLFLLWGLVTVFPWLIEFLLLLVSVLTGFCGRGLSALSPTPNLEHRGSTLIVWSLPFNLSGMSTPTSSRKLQPTVGWRGFLKSCTYSLRRQLLLDEWEAQCKLNKVQSWYPASPVIETHGIITLDKIRFDVIRWQWFS